ncbi:MAG: hypothetical protein IPM29_26065 [Planctomycetes bacterium]|nr:hypothetical protein [Planctomycetota bacterium]
MAEEIRAGRAPRDRFRPALPTALGWPLGRSCFRPRASAVAALSVARDGDIVMTSCCAATDVLFAALSRATLALALDLRRRDRPGSGRSVLLLRLGDVQLQVIELVLLGANAAHPGGWSIEVRLRGDLQPTRIRRISAVLVGSDERIVVPLTANRRPAQPSCRTPAPRPAAWRSAHVEPARRTARRDPRHRRAQQARSASLRPCSTSLSPSLRRC